ncbi:hypothetical protein SUDANB180_07407 [Streptomyces sp. enrichment culture]
MSDSVHIGMAPFQGISTGVDRESPVSWPLYERQRTFRFSRAATRKSVLNPSPQRTRRYVVRMASVLTSRQLPCK